MQASYRVYVNDNNTNNKTISRGDQHTVSNCRQMSGKNPLPAARYD